MSERYAPGDRVRVRRAYPPGHVRAPYFTRGKVGEVSCGPGIDQDVAIWSTQQKGLTSRGFRGEYMPTQERRIRFFHDNLDRYISGQL